MRRLIAVGIVTMALLWLVTAVSPAATTEGKTMTEGKTTMEGMAMMEMAGPGEAQAALKTAMRKLWEDHITYTRNYIISALAGLEDKDAIAGRLLKNQEDLGNAIKPYYGEEAGTKLTALLKAHILIATEVVAAAKDGKTDELGKAQAKWTANGDEIAAFLAGANPNWSKADMTEMLHKHLEYTTAEVTSRLKKDWAADIEAYDKGHAHMLMFADMLSEGIVKQFPQKFMK